MNRIITEQLQCSESEVKLILDFKSLFSDLQWSIKKQEAFPTLSDLYLDTEHLLKTIDDYLDKYCS